MINVLKIFSILGSFVLVNHAYAVSLVAEVVPVTTNLAKVATALSLRSLQILPGMTQAFEAASTGQGNPQVFEGAWTPDPYGLFSEMSSVLGAKDGARILALAGEDATAALYDSHMDALDPLEPHSDLKSQSITSISDDAEFARALSRLSRDQFQKANYLVLQIRLVKMDLVRLGLAQLDENGELVRTKDHLEVRDDMYGYTLMERLDTCMSLLQDIGTLPKAIIEAGTREGTRTHEFIEGILKETTADEVRY